MIPKADPFADRESKIAMFKKKKELEQALDQLKNYKDEEMKRNFYMNALFISILKSLEQFRVIEQEV